MPQSTAQIVKGELHELQEEMAGRRKGGTAAAEGAQAIDWRSRRVGGARVGVTPLSGQDLHEMRPHRDRPSSWPQVQKLV